MSPLTPPLISADLTTAQDGAMFAGPDAEAVVAVASRAPSIHNTQPWRWLLHDGVLDLCADRSRQLHVADPDEHSLLVSCGAAAELTQLALAAQGWKTTTSLMPDAGDPDLLARFEPTSRGTPDRTAMQHTAAAGRRRSDRRVFGPQPVSTEVIERLRDAAQGPAVYADFPVGEDQSLQLAVAISRADSYERDYPAYAAEMAAWVRSDPTSADGVPASVIPAVTGDEPRHTDVPVRDFEQGVSGTQLIAGGVDEHPLIAVIFTEGDGSRQRLRAGQSMMRLMIQAELDGIASCPLSQSVDLVFFRSQLRELMSWTESPQMMLRLGQQPDAVAAPLTARRPIGDVLTIAAEGLPRPGDRSPSLEVEK